ncbi:MAG: GNAT family N-acetyltransferase [Bacteroidota bacterium]
MNPLNIQPDNAMALQINSAVFEEFPVLQTPRLTLRDIQQEDAEAIFQMRANARVGQFIARPDMEDPKDAAELVAKTRVAYARKEAIGWAGLLRDGSEIIGTCGFNRIEARNLRAELGGEMATAYWGKRIAVEAVTEIVRFGLHTMGLHTIEAKVEPDNRGAIFLLESLGFVKEALFRERVYFEEQFRDMAVLTLHKGREKF